jgi:hypothetical protein
VLVELIEEVGDGFGHLEFILNGLVLASTLVLSGVADDGVSGLSVVAEEGEATGEEGDGVSSDIDSGGGSDAVEPLGPLLVAHSGGAEGDDFNVLEFFGSLDIDEADGCEAASQTDTGDDESFGVDLFSQASDDIGSDLFPHAVVFSLDFASLGGFFILDLSGGKSTWKAQSMSCQTFLRLAV